jgi:hypothetical protein
VGWCGLRFELHAFNRCLTPAAAANHDAGFKKVRFHGILDDDMSTYLNGGANMFNVFSTFDFLCVRPP